ncbi:MAG: class I SAM-dependent methyltransferase [archaeon]
MKAVKPKKWKTPYLEDIHVKWPASVYSLRKFETIMKLSPTGRERVIDVGCGLGYFLLTLAKYNNEVIGLDREVILGEVKENTSYADGKWKDEAKGKTLMQLVREMIETELGKENKVKLIESDAKKIPLKDKSVDVAYMLDVMEHIKEKELVLKEVKRILKDDGVFILSVPDTESMLMRKIITRMHKIKELEDHEHFKWKQFTEELKKEFKIEMIKKYPTKLLSMSIIIKARK